MFSVLENSLNLDAVNLDTLYLVKLIFGEYFCHFDSNRVAILLQLQLYLDANRVLVRKKIKVNEFHLMIIINVYMGLGTTFTYGSQITNWTLKFEKYKCFLGI